MDAKKVERMVEMITEWNNKKNSCYSIQIGQRNVAKQLVELLELNEELVEQEFAIGMEEYTLDNLTKLIERIKNKQELIVIEEVKEVEVVEEKSKTKRTRTPSVSSKDADESASELAQVIAGAMATFKKSKIDKVVKESVEQYIQGKALIKVVQIGEVKREVKGVTHGMFENILQFVSADEPVLLVGPAGTGKNKICEQLADAMGVPFYFSNAVTQEYKLTGFVDAMGKYIETQFFKAFTEGGLFMLDEIDASMPEALVILNCAIANRYFDFPLHGKVTAHPNFRVIACANTYGTGASAEYVGRNQLDGATLNRFAMVEVDYDPNIEDLIATKEDGSTDVVLLEFVRAFRNACYKNGVQHIVSYREIERLNKMLNYCNMEPSFALKSCLIKGLEVTSVQQIKSSMDIPNNKMMNYLNKVINNYK